MFTKALLSLVAVIVASAPVRAGEEQGAARQRGQVEAVKISVVGAKLDSNLDNGGGTDDTAVLQHVLDRGKLGGAVHLILDGPALVSGLVVYSNTTIECIAGGGLYLKDNSDRAIIQNAHYSDRKS